MMRQTLNFGNGATSEMNTPAIIIESLLKRFEDATAVDGVSLQVEEGELFGLLGARATRAA
jgi:ABC-type sugar transport system ATPase subunit